MFINPNSLARQEPRSGVSTRVAWGKKIMLSFIDLAPHSITPSHSHPHEQMDIVLSGEFELTIGKESRRLQEGDAYLIPSNVEHSVRALERQSRALDIFSPPREDYKR
ncbi:cupin domain-containing protein [Chloroflexota bacterium]